MPDASHARVLIIATNGFEESELFEPRQALLDAGAKVTVASLDHDEIYGTVHDVKTKTIRPDALIADMRHEDFDALVLPGGVANPDKLRTVPEAVELVRAFTRTGKPVAAICHGPWLLVEADVLKGKTATAWPSIRTDLRNAGAEVIDREVVVDGNLITSRKPEDIPAFNAALFEALKAK